jgi:alpha-N-arabinofuranosidase
MQLYRHTSTSDQRTAAIRVDPAERADHEIPPELYAKFAEHLGWNISHGMDAQLCFNPTFGEWRFPAGSANAPDGGQQWAHDPDEVDAQIEEFAEIQDFPDSEPLREAYSDAGAFWWQRCGDAAAVQFSPDTGPTGNRAQRVEIEPDTGERGGIRQWLYLPLQRTDGYELTVQGRAVDSIEVTVALHTTSGDGDPETEVASATLSLDAEWTTHEADLTVGDVPGADPPISVTTTCTPSRSPPTGTPISFSTA